MDRRQYQPVVDVGGTSPNDRFVPEIRVLDVFVSALGTEPRRLARLQALSSLVSDLRPEVIHSYSLYTNTLPGGWREIRPLYRLRRCNAASFQNVDIRRCLGSCLPDDLTLTFSIAQQRRRIPSTSLHFSVLLAATSSKTALSWVSSRLSACPNKGISWLWEAYCR